MILFWTGDVNPYDHGGGVVVDNGDRILWYFWSGKDTDEDWKPEEDSSLEDLDSTSEEHWDAVQALEAGYKFAVRDLEVPEDVLQEFDYVDVDSVASYIGVDSSELLEASSSDVVEERVWVLESLVSHGIDHFNAWLATEAQINAHVGYQDPSSHAEIENG